MVSDLREGYKSTEIGKIPIEWRVEKLSDVSRNVTIGLVKTMTAHYTDKGTPLIRNSDIKENKILKEKLVFLNENFAKENEGKRLQLEDVVTVHTGDIGTSAVINKDLVGAHGFATLNTTPNIKVMNAYYLSWYFNSFIFKKQAYAVATGDGRSNLNLKDFINTKIAFPKSILEQEKIVSVLSSVDEAIEKTEAIIEQIEKVKRGLMQQLLTKGIGHTKFKKTEIGNVPEEWDLVVLNDVILSLDAGVSVNSENRNKESDEKGILKTSAVTNRIFNPKEHKTILPTEIDRAKVTPKKGHIIISRMNTKELVGASSYVDSDYDDLFLPDRLWQATIDVSNVSPVWLSFVLTSAEVRSRIGEIATGTSGSMKNISKKSFLSLKIALPNKGEQEKIANILDCFDKKQLAERTKVAKLSTLKQGLMQSLLTGKVRVKVDEVEVTQV
ncbi:restriction endonuclease subunit S [Bacillus cereus group sp. BfR-BA-01380]|uniref:restriction endonuclease subunit S n=1 Tax=Bacillus cereus group sp. BfR-BA-01380 TaxID=2920324 RepID=UPI001F58AD3B|nr:restriction endonuclease subunit S [Bacillus cereus group sp. BfR-BA-01380]